MTDLTKPAEGMPKQWSEYWTATMSESDRVRLMQTEIDTLRARCAALQADAERLRNEITALTHEGRQGELEQANVGLAVENERLREGLRWYADGHHYDLDDWDYCSGESSNWLFPPTEHGWMVDNGGIARSILDHGHSINPNHESEDYITIAPDAARGDK